MVAPDCPWEITDRAVDRYQAIEGLSDAHAAREALTHLCVLTLARMRQSGGAPHITSSGLRVYRGPGPRRLRVVVDGDERVVDVLPGEHRSGSGRRGGGARATHWARLQERLAQYAREGRLRPRRKEE